MLRHTDRLADGLLLDVGLIGDSRREKKEHIDDEMFEPTLQGLVAIVLGEHALEVATDGPIWGDVDLAPWLNHAVDRLRDLLEVRPVKGARDYNAAFFVCEIELLDARVRPGYLCP